MARFESLKHSPSETRRILRERLRRNLATHNDRPPPHRERSEVQDESALALLFDLAIDFESDEPHVRAGVDAERASRPSAPAFDELVELGWLRVTWGRVSATMDIHRALDGAPEDIKNVLGPFMKGRFRKTFTLRSDLSAIDDLRPLVSAIRENPEDLPRILPPDPAWVAARLWERATDHREQPTRRLRHWIDLSTLIESPVFAPGAVWDLEDASTFRAAAIDVLKSERSLLPWEQERSRFVNRLALAGHRTAAELDRIVPALPSTLVDRHLWFERRDWDHVRDDFDACRTLWGITNLLLRDVEETDQGPWPEPVTRGLFDLAIDRPELLWFLILRVRRQPELLADLILDPRLSALACLIVAEWQPCVRRPNVIARIGPS
jgi:hypothetical protein